MSAQTIDLTPTWPEACTMLLAVMEAGTPQGRKMARAELMRMADLAQRYVDSRKPAAPLGADELVVSIKPD